MAVRVDVFDRSALICADAGRAKCRVEDVAGRRAPEHDVRNERLKGGLEAIDVALAVVEEHDGEAVGRKFRRRVVGDLERVVVAVDQLAG